MKRLVNANLAFALGSVASAALLTACGGDDTCDPIGQTGCDTGQVCENVAGGEPACFAPLTVTGRVFDLVSDASIEGARVVALDVNGAAVSSVAISAADGTYSLPIPTTRMEDGTPVTTVELTLRASAAGYQTFPSGVRQALPIDTATAVAMGDGLVIDNAQTDIGLIELPDGSGTGSIFGSVELPESGAGVLVVAESGGAGYVGIANLDGDYRIFNLPDGNYTVKAYARGINYTGVDVTIAADEQQADLVINGDPPGTVTGTIQIVNAPGGSVTTVILVVESTYDDLVGRGQTVPGLRAPDPGIPANIEGTYTIEGVPAGNYVVLAAFEEDNLVRDPDLSIGGTTTLHITVTAGGTTTVDGFKVTEALAIISPGAGAAEMITGTPTFEWVDDSSEDEYLVEVFDVFGERIWMQSIPGESGNDPQLPYGGPALEPGMYYQWRATSLKTSVPLSRTEDLEGVFFLPAP